MKMAEVYAEFATRYLANLANCVCISIFIISSVHFDARVVLFPFALKVI